MTIQIWGSAHSRAEKMSFDYRKLPLAVSMAVLVLASSGCAVGPDFKAAEAPKVKSFTRDEITQTVSAPTPGGASQKVINGKEIDHQWWRSFASPALNELVDAAFKNNPSVTSAQAALRQAQENSAAQRGSYFPVVQASYSPSRQRNAVGTISPTLTSGDPVYTLHTAQLSITYVPDVFGLNRRTVESLVAQEEVQNFQLEATYLTLASNVVNAAIQLAMLKAQIQSSQDIVRAAEKSLQVLQRQAALGFATGLDVSAQETALAQAKLALPPLQKQFDQTQDLLSVLTGEMPSQSHASNFDLDAFNLPEELPLSLPASLVSQRPDVRAAEAQVHAASAQVGIAIANRLPQFSLSANLGGTSKALSHMFSAGNQFWGATGNVTQTLLDFGTLKHREKSAEAALDQATAQYKSVVLVAFQNVADTLYALDADAKALQAAVNAETAAKKTLDLTRKQFELGFVNISPLLIAEQAYEQTKVSRIQNQAARFTDTAALFQSLGGGWWNRQ